MQELLAVLPFLHDRLVRMRPKLLAALAQDSQQMAGRVIFLRELLPGADLICILSQR